MIHTSQQLKALVRNISKDRTLRISRFKNCLSAVRYDKSHKVLEGVTMYIPRILIKNYRCFRDFSMEFQKGTECHKDRTIQVRWGYSMPYGF